ncbi:MAG TPA: hypothetical protein VME66_07515 [Candidatus Acidoferrales bacterium]|nr:hypothetical protein [Candidatus Acidoferrales bacterium]
MVHWNPRLVDVASVADDAVAQLHARYPGRQLTLRCESAMVAADYGDLQVAVRRLVENALRHAPESPVEVAVAVASRGTTITVSDHDGLHTALSLPLAEEEPSW